MTKINRPHLHLYIEYKNGSCKDHFLPASKALELFSFYVDCFMQFPDELHSVRSVRVGSPNHIRFEFRDVRNIVNQNNMFDYD